MHLGIDGQRLTGQRLGIGRYIEALLAEWSAILGPEDRIELFLRGRGPHAVDSLPGIRPVPLAPSLTGFLWQNLVLGSRLKEMDVLFCPSYLAPIARSGRYVVAVHSVEAAEPDSQSWHHRYTYDRAYRMSARRAVSVIAPSRVVSEQIQEFYRVPADQIVVIPQGADPGFRPSNDAAAKAETRRRLVGADRPYLVFVGKLSHRRNIPLLMEAFAALVHEDHIPHALLLLGPNHLGLPIADQAKALGIADRVVQDDGRFTSHLDLVDAYTAAECYVSASSYEGFSMTMVEAMSCGTPIVAMHRGAIPEITGDAAQLVRDLSAQAIASGIRQVLLDASVRQALRDRGLARAESFRWPEIAERTLAVLRTAGE